MSDLQQWEPANAYGGRAFVFDSYGKTYCVGFFEFLTEPFIGFNRLDDDGVWRSEFFSTSISEEFFRSEDFMPYLEDFLSKVSQRLEFRAGDGSGPVDWRTGFANWLADYLQIGADELSVSVKDEAPAPNE